MRKRGLYRKTSNRSRQMTATLIKPLAENRGETARKKEKEPMGQPIGPAGGGEKEPRPLKYASRGVLTNAAQVPERKMKIGKAIRKKRGSKTKKKDPLRTKKKEEESKKLRGMDFDR